jgi:[ribosomal protein S18]-alanine N-acetyltransferase
MRRLGSSAVPKRPPARAEIRIRRARASDLPRLIAIEDQVFATDRMSARQLRHHLGNPQADVLVALREGTVAGAAVVFFHANHRIARLYSIAVAPEARGAGVGAALLAAAERSARARGRERFRLEVRTENAAAQRLYERRGYRVFGTKAGFYEDGHDAVRYEKALARGRVSPSRP